MLPIYENPIPAACLIVVDNQDRLLLVKRSVEPKIGHWCLPGGFMELGESPEQAGLRELEEETGLKGKNLRLFEVDSNTGSIYDTVTLICYTIKDYQGIPVAGDDASDVKFFRQEELPKAAFETHRKFIRNYYSPLGS